MIDWSLVDSDEHAMAIELRQARDAAIRALQAIALDWGARPDARTLADLRRAGRGDLAMTRRVARAEEAVARLIALTPSLREPSSDAASEWSVWTCGALSQS